MDFSILACFLTFLRSDIAKTYVLYKSQIAKVIKSFIDKKQVEQHNGNKKSTKMSKTLLEKCYRQSIILIFDNISINYSKATI